MTHTDEQDGASPRRRDQADDAGETVLDKGEACARPYALVGTVNEAVSFALFLSERLHHADGGQRLLRYRQGGGY